MLKLFIAMVPFSAVHFLSVVALPLRERLAAFWLHQRWFGDDPLIAL